MAEILLSLTIIGVVAAITLPSLTGNINERTWNTQRKALYSRFSQAIALMPALNGYGTLIEGEDGSIEDTAAETFVTDGLAKVLKINNICDSEHLQDCGIPKKITNIDASVISSIPTTLVGYNSKFNGSGVGTWNEAYSYSQIDTKAAAFETQNGESILVFYNPYCIGNLRNTKRHKTQPKMCANFIYDLNGSRGPNTVGKDIGFMTALYATETEFVAPMPAPKRKSNANPHGIHVANACKEQNEDFRPPNRSEAASLFYNQLLVGEQSGWRWTSDIESTTSYDGRGSQWSQDYSSGDVGTFARSGLEGGLRCIRKF